jgi:hypothetical protein
MATLLPTDGGSDRAGEEVAVMTGGNRWTCWLAAMGVVCGCAAALAAADESGASALLTQRVVSGAGSGPSIEEVDGMLLTRTGPTPNGGSFVRGAPVPVGAGSYAEASTRCSEREAHIAGMGGIPPFVTYTLWKLWNHSAFCYNGRAVHHVHVSADSYTAPLWGGGPATASWTYLGQGVRSAKTTARGFFYLGTASYNIQQVRPRISLILHANGVSVPESGA